MRYEWREGARYPVKAQVVGQALERIDRLNGGITPRVVVESSRPEDAPLHPIFEWDDATASELYREDQARRVIRSVRVIEVDQQGRDQPPSIAYVSVRAADADGPSYQPTARVMSDADLRRQAIADALAGLEAWVRRHEHLTELAAELRVARRVHRRAARRLKEAEAAPAMA
jgi:hypothetical protein